MKRVPVIYSAELWSETRGVGHETQCEWERSGVSEEGAREVDIADDPSTASGRPPFRRPAAHARLTSSIRPSGIGSPSVADGTAGRRTAQRSSRLRIGIALNGCQMTAVVVSASRQYRRTPLPANWLGNLAGGDIRECCSHRRETSSRSANGEHRVDGFLNGFCVTLSCRVTPCGTSVL